MIISASRRTDIPAFYGEWFMNRVRAGWCLVPNPFNMGRMSRVSLHTTDVDALVFWSKDPAPFLPHLDELDDLGYRYYFLFTLNAYPAALEPNVPPLGERLETFRTLSRRLGPQRVVWRYDPIIISSMTGPDFHKDRFAAIAGELRGATHRVVVSFVDFYRKTDRHLSQLEREGFHFNREPVSAPVFTDLLRDLASIAVENGMEITSCAEDTDFSESGVSPGRCIDERLLNSLWGLDLGYEKDAGQRPPCLCMISRDIGVNDTCLHGCPYCYATRSDSIARRRFSEHDPESPVLWASPEMRSRLSQYDYSQPKLI